MMDLISARNKNTVPHPGASVKSTITQTKRMLNALTKIVNIRSEEDRFVSENVNLFSREFGKLLVRIIKKRTEGKTAPTTRD